MPITADQNADLQKQYDVLRAQGMSSADATNSIRNKLKSTVVENPTAGTSSSAFDMLKSGYKSGGVEGDWIGNGTPSPTAATVNESTGVTTPSAQPNTDYPASG